MITENLSTLKIHKLTQEQYDRERDAGRLDANALYLTPDDLNITEQVERAETAAAEAENARKLTMSYKNTTLEYRHNALNDSKRAETAAELAEEYRDNAYNSSQVAAYYANSAEDAATRAEEAVANVENVDLTGYATENWVGENYQPKGNYLTQVPEGYAKTEDIPTVPTNVSAFTNDAGYLTEHQSLDGLASELYVDNKIAAIPTVPTKVSAFTNDAGYLTEHQSLEGYAKTSELDKYIPLTALEGTGSTTEAITADAFEIGGLYADDGSDRDNDTRVRTDFIPCSVNSPISIVCNSSVKWLAHYFAGDTWIDKTFMVSASSDNILEATNTLSGLPIDKARVTHVKILLGYVNDSTVTDIDDLVGNFTITQHIIDYNGIIATKEWVKELLGGIENGTY